MKAEPLLVEEEGKKGKFEEANGGTIFRDEIEEMQLICNTSIQCFKKKRLRD